MYKCVQYIEKDNNNRRGQKVNQTEDFSGFLPFLILKISCHLFFVHCPLMEGGDEGTGQYWREDPGQCRGKMFEDIDPAP